MDTKRGHEEKGARMIRPKFPLQISRKWLIAKEIGLEAAVANWVRYARLETFKRSKARCCTGVGVVIIWQVSSPIWTVFRATVRRSCRRV